MSTPETEQRITAFIRAVGLRVREAREKKDLSRRELSETSGVSQRYLAQIEAGEGNISIALLLRVAIALGSDVATFIAEPPPSKARRIALIGLRGAGKSTLGNRISRIMELPFVELNRDIEDLAGVPLNEVLALYGPEGYRRLEAQALDRVITTRNHVVMAVAGGIVSEAETYDKLLRNFHCIWLRAKPEDHMDRVRKQGDLRPMQGKPEAMSQLRGLLAQRESLYARAEQRLDTSGRSVERSAAELLQLIRSAGLGK